MIQAEQGGGAYKAVLLTEYGIGKVGVLFRQIEEFGEPFPHTLAQNAAGTYGNKALHGLVAHALGIVFRMEEHHQPGHTVGRHNGKTQEENKGNP